MSRAPQAKASIATDAAAAKKDSFFRDLRSLVEIESPSGDRGAVNRMGSLLSSMLSGQGGKVTIHPGGDYGDHIEARFSEGAGKPLLLLGHFDTVWEMGTLASMPYRVDRGRIFGPGVLDMKAGIVMAMHAVQLLREQGELPRPVTLLFVTDEEVGSHSSRPVTERLARESEAVLVLEPAQQPGGALKTARKGVGVFEVKVTGQPAHAGVDFGAGASAIVEMAGQVRAISELSDLSRGLTLNVGVIHGGTRSNVIAAECTAEVDVRVTSMADAERIAASMRALKPSNPKCRIEVTGGVNRPPMVRTEQIAALFRKAQEIGRGLGIPLEERSTGGGSDGNFTAALGIPTLDGLGAVGEGAHALNESIEIEHIAPRTALLANLIAAI